MLVDVIHTDGGDDLWHANHLGMAKAIGHIDVYANSGIFQPGCPSNTLLSYEGFDICATLCNIHTFY